MLRVARCLWCALTLLVPLMAPSNASEICPPRTSTYDKCPQGFSQSWPIPPLPSYIETDSVADPVGDGLWEYHWCIKSSARVDDEIFFIWPDLKVTGARTGCGGFWGHNMQSLSPPSDLQSNAAVGPELTEIQPQIKFPTDQIPKPAFDQILDFFTRLFTSLSLDKAGEKLITVGLAIRSTATPVVASNQHIKTRYKLEYMDSLSDGASSIRFSFSDNLTERAKELDRLFSFSDKPRSLEFTEAGPPTNVIGTLVFVGPDGYEVGAMLVSLAVPSD